MGTTYLFRALDAPVELTEDDLQGRIERVLERVDHSMSTYREDSELSRLNHRPSTEAVTVSPELYSVLEEALKIGRMTRGGFDVTVGPLVDAYGFGPSPPGDLPSEVKIAELRSHTGLDKIELDSGTRSVRKLHPAVFVDLSGIAKGYAVDGLAELARELGIDRYFIEVGGEVRARGRRADGRLWRVGIERPEAVAGTIQRAIPLDDSAVATSGDYRNFRVVDGEKWTHLIDPRTGRPARHRLASITVVQPRCSTADALATGLWALGPDAALELARENGWPVLMLVRETDGGFSELTSPAFDELIRSAAVQRAPATS